MRSTSSTVEDYAKAIYALESGEGEGRVSVNALAARLNVTPGSASGMVKKLVERELVTHAPYRAVSLTPAGARLAVEVIRHHRLLELYLAQELGMPWDRVHDEAEVLEHVISEEIEERIARKLGDPTHDPHGDPIPTADLEIQQRRTVRLADLEAGAVGRFTRISDADPHMLRYLTERRISRGNRLEVAERQPFGGPLALRFWNDAGEETRETIGGGLAQAMHVEPED